ncbi:MAG: Xaa-Pro peptidase family protein [Candidatus Eremiobacteraeota bacterium]|nr:Xaa-Pro peptidase family protein [Candidatus Eremiobacteraeota bacterium]
MNKSLLKEKIAQAHGIMKEKAIDLWLTFVRESDTIRDPALQLILGKGVTWQSAFVITATGATCAIVGSLDVANIESTGLYRRVTGYVAGIKEPLIELLREHDPAKIAINTSKNDVMSDGLTHGMYCLLMDMLEGSPYKERLVSSEDLMAALRGRKSAGEIALIEKAVAITEDIFTHVTGSLKRGYTEKEVASLINAETAARNVVPAWDTAHCPAVFTGPESAGAHASPTERVIEGGHVMNVDFGVKYEDYCSDLQRTWYFLKEGEEGPPQEVQKAFETVKEAIEKAAEFIRPGMEGYRVDEVARGHITAAGYEEYPHGLGHQVGRSTHDGAGLLCPRWERYGLLPFLKVEEGQVYTLEPRVTLPRYGVLTMEEIIVVTPGGCRFLSHPQKELFLVAR